MQSKYLAVLTLPLKAKGEIRRRVNRRTLRVNRRSTRRLIGHGSARPGSPSRLAELHEPSSSPIPAPSDRSWLDSRRLAQARQPTCRARRAEHARQVTRRLIGPGSPNRARQPTCRARRAEQLADPRAV